jgi:hypothetical protein
METATARRRPPEVAVLVASCDAYSDLWTPFFTLFRRYWPDCPYPVYLGSNSQEYPEPSVRSILVGPDVDWSTGFGAMLERVEEPYVLVLLEDYLLSAPVDTARIERLVGYMQRRGAACMRLMPVPGPPASLPDFPDAGELSRGTAYRLSLQAAVWRREDLLSLVRPGESPWQLELEGTKRTEGLSAPFLSVVRDSRRPLPYVCTAVVKGAWIREAVRLCRREGIAVDLTRRERESWKTYAHRKTRRWRDHIRELRAAAHGAWRRHQ